MIIISFKIHNRKKLAIPNSIVWWFDFHPFTTTMFPDDEAIFVINRFTVNSVFHSLLLRSIYDFSRYEQRNWFWANGLTLFKKLSISVIVQQINYTNHFSNNFHFFLNVNTQLLLPFTINSVALCQFIVQIVWILVSGFSAGNSFFFIVWKMVKENGTLLSRWIVEGKKRMTLWLWGVYAKKSFSFDSTFPCWTIICFIFFYFFSTFFIHSSEQHWMQVMKETEKWKWKNWKL